MEEWSIFSESFQKRKPISVVLEVIESCNLRCQHCYLYPHQLEKGHFLPFKEWQKIIDFLNKIGLIFVEVTGGEPFFHPEIIPILDYLSRYNFFINIISNGTLLDEKKLRFLKDKKIVTLFLSLYGSKPEIHEQITGVKGSFTKLIQTIETAKTIGLKVVLKTSIGKDNYKDLDNLISLAQSYNLLLQIGFLTLPNQTGKIADYSFQGEKLERIIEKVFAYNESRGVSLMLSPESPSGECSALKSSFAVSWDGTVRPCPGINYQLGNILKISSWEELWYNRKVEAFLKREFASKCRRCEHYEKCNPCPFFMLTHQEERLCEIYEQIERYKRKKQTT